MLYMITSGNFSVISAKSFSLVLTLLTSPSDERPVQSQQQKD